MWYSKSIILKGIQGIPGNGIALLKCKFTIFSDGTQNFVDTPMAIHSHLWKQGKTTGTSFDERIFYREMTF